MILRVLLLLVLMSGTIEAQELDKHRWEHRLLVVFTSEFNTAEVQEQLEVLELAKGDLEDRKLKVYTISEDKFRFGFTEIDHPVTKKRNITKPFEIVLIGLDGGEKYRSDEVQPMETFNELIDQMAMRRNEIKNKN